MSTIKAKLERLEGKLRMRSNYAEIIRKHAIEHKRGYGKDEGMLVHTVVALYTISYPEHKGSFQARNYLEWMHNQSFNAIPRAYAAIKDLISAGLATFAPQEFASDGRDISGMTPPYAYLCDPSQIQRYSTDGQFWADL